MSDLTPALQAVDCASNEQGRYYRSGYIDNGDNMGKPARLPAIDMLRGFVIVLPRPLIALVAALLIVPHNALDTINSGNVLWLAWHPGRLRPLGAMNR
jgi:uncharacterized membrane protein